MSKFILSAFADEIDPKLSVQMEVLDKHGIKYIEMRGVNGKNLTSYSLDEVKEIKKQLDANGFKISSVGSPIGKIKITDNFEPHLELFRHTIEIAKILEAKYIRMFSFYLPEADSPALYRDEVMNRLSRFLKAAEGTSIILLHENEKGIYGDTPERCLDLLDTMNNSYMKAVFDPANFVQCQVETFPAAFEMLKKHIAYIHIKDALYKDHSVVPAGYGDGKVKDILKELYKSGYNGFLSLEPHLANFVGFSELESSTLNHQKPDRSMEAAGPKHFSAAVWALKKILGEIEN